MVAEQEPGAKVKAYDELVIEFSRMMVDLEEAVELLADHKVPPTAYITWSSVGDKFRISARWDKRLVAPPEPRGVSEFDIPFEKIARIGGAGL